MAGLYTGASGVWGGYSGLLYGSTALSTPPGLLADVAASTWTPAQLFSASDGGAWYDPSDLSTMSQDTGFATPVTAVEQTVGLILDKRNGGALGTELAGGVSVPFTVFRDAVTNTPSPNLAAVTSGKTYVCVATVSVNPGTTGASYRVGVTGQVGGGIGGGLTGVITRYITCTNTGTLILYGDGAGVNFTVTSISVKEYLGCNAYQSSAGSRPTLSSRVNLLTYSEQFTNSIWGKFLSTVSGSKLIPNNGQALNSAYITQSITKIASAAIPYVFSVTAQKAEYDSVTLYAQDAGNAANNATVTVSLIDGSIVSAATASGAFTGASVSVTGPGPSFTIFFNFTTGTDASLIVRIFCADSVATTGNGTSGVILGSADVRYSGLSVGIPAYQRITSSTNYDTTGFPRYLRFGGSPVHMVMSTPGASATNAFNLISGGFRTGGGATAFFSIGAAGASTSYPGMQVLIRGNSGPEYSPQVLSASTTATGSLLTNATFAFGNTATKVISTSRTAISVNSVSLSTTGSFVDFTGFGNTNNRFGCAYTFQNTNFWVGNIYGMILRYAASGLDASSIALATAWMNSKTRAY